MAEDKRGNGTAAETSPNNDRGPHQVAAEASEIVRAALTELPLFRMTAQGLYWDPGEEKAPTWLSPYFDVLAHTRDVDGGQWGLLLSWRDLDHRVHEWAMPLAALGGGREEIWRALLAGGLRITPTPAGREKLAQYLSTVKVQGRALAVARIGWHLRSAAAAAFVLPDRTYGKSAYERIRWQTENRSETPYRCAGGLDDWRHHIGGRCKGNSRLVFGISAGFAAPLLQIAGQESGGLHFVGSSRSGKTTILHVAGSVWGGGGGISGYLRSWRSTANSLEAVAEAHCDTLLCLDELGQVNAREAGEVAYMLANGTGKVGLGATGLRGAPRNGEYCSCHRARSALRIRWPRRACARGLDTRSALLTFQPLREQATARSKILTVRRLPAISLTSCGAPPRLYATGPRSAITSSCLSTSMLPTLIRLPNACQLVGLISSPNTCLAMHPARCVLSAAVSHWSQRPES